MNTTAPAPAPPSAPQAPVRRAALTFIFVTVMLDMLAVGVIVPVLPARIQSVMHGDFASAAGMLGLFGTVWALMQFISMPVLGALSDTYGRRPIVLLSNFGLGLDYILMAYAPSITILFIGRVISGITAASVTTSSAYIADVTPPERRAAAFGYLGSAFGLGFIIGPAVGGFLGSKNPDLPFLFAAALSLCNGLYGLFVLPESLPRERRAKFTWRTASPRGALEILRTRPALRGLASVQFLSNLAHNVLPSASVIYLEYRYHWTHNQVGLMLAGIGLSSMIVQTGLVRPLVKRFGERHALLGGLVCGVLAFALYGTAPTGAIFLAGVPLMALWGVAGASAQSLMSRGAGPSEQGRLQGALSAVQAFAGMIGPMLFTQTFELFIGPWSGFGLPGAPFLVSTTLLIAALFVALRVTSAPAPPQATESIPTIG